MRVDAPRTLLADLRRRRTRRSPPRERLGGTVGTVGGVSCDSSVPTLRKAAVVRSGGLPCSAGATPGGTRSVPPEGSRSAVGLPTPECGGARSKPAVGGPAESAVRQPPVGVLSGESRRLRAAAATRRNGVSRRPTVGSPPTISYDSVSVRVTSRSRSVSANVLIDSDRRTRSAVI